MIVIVLTAIYIGRAYPGFTGEWVKSYLNRDLINFLIILNITTYFWDVTRWAYINSKKPTPFKRDYSMMARNAIIVVIAFEVYWLIK